MRSIFFVAFILIAQAAFACDFCNGYLGINPHYKKNKIALRGNYSFSQLKDVTVGNTYVEKYSEQRHSAELFAELYPVQKLQVLVYVPYVDSESKITSGNNLHQRLASGAGTQHLGEPAEENAVKKISYKGLGDATLLMHYQLYNRMPPDSSSISHRIMAGGGVRFPSGNSKVKDDAYEEQLHAPGTGSFSELVSLVYLARKNRISFLFNANAMMSQPNKHNFITGTRFNSTVGFYYAVGKKESYFPSLGCTYEQAQRDRLNDVRLTDSGGSVLFLQSGHDVYFKHFGISLSAYLPVSVNINGLQTKNKFKASFAVSYAW